MRASDWFMDCIDTIAEADLSPDDTLQLHLSCIIVEFVEDAETSGQKIDRQWLRQRLLEFELELPPSL